VQPIFSIFEIMTIQLIDKLYESGELRPLIEAGLISPNVLNWRKVYNTYQSLIKNGSKEMQAKEGAADTHNIGVRSVYRILEFLNYEPTEKPNEGN
jgi:hypothetical protein